MKTDTHLWPYLTHFFLKWEIFQTNLKRKSKQILCSIILFENSAVYEKIWKNIVEMDRLQRTLWRTRTTCWIPKATNTLRICNTYCFSTATMAVQKRLRVSLYSDCLSFFWGGGGQLKIWRKRTKEIHSQWYITFSVDFYETAIDWNAWQAGA